MCDLVTVAVTPLPTLTDEEYDPFVFSMEYNLIDTALIQFVIKSPPSDSSAGSAAISNHHSDIIIHNKQA
jgi:hypothetical protein